MPLYHWSIGDRNYTGSVERLADNKIVTKLTFMPVLQDNGMLLRCWKGDQFDSLNLTVFQQDVLYQSTYSTRLPTSLSAELKLFPEPEASMVTWKIKSLDGGSMDFHPGTENQDLNIVTNKIEKVADDVFKFGLEIKELDDVAMKNISLVVVTSMEKEVIYFQPQEEIVVKTMFLTIPWWLWLSVCA